MSDQDSDLELVEKGRIGLVKWMSNVEQYGMITVPDLKEGDVFFYDFDVMVQGSRYLPPNVTVIFDLYKKKRVSSKNNGLTAKNIRIHVCDCVKG